MSGSATAPSNLRILAHSTLAGQSAATFIAEAVFGYHQPEIFEVFAESIFKLRESCG